MTYIFRIMDLFECSVCLNDMLERAPRILPCLHSFCTECLQQLINNNKINCPTCREITELKSNDVNELKVNFNLRQMKEQMEGQKEKEQEKPPPGTKTKSLCQICHQTEALFKCKDCPDLLCEPCKKKHGDVEDFKSHAVFDLCLIHDEGITHLCKQCIKPLCKRCMLLDHAEHKMYFVKYEKGVGELQNDAKTKQENIMKKIRLAEKNHEEMKAKYQRVTDIEEVCYDQKKHLNDKMSAEDKALREKIAELEAASKERKQHLEQRIKEANTILKETDIKKKSYSKLKELYDKEHNQCMMAAASLNSLTSSKSGFCDRYKKITQKADQCLVNIQKVVDAEYTLPPSLRDSSPGESVKPAPALSKLMNLKVYKTLLTLNKSDQINVRWDIAFIGNDVLLPTASKPYRVVRVDMSGQFVQCYYPQDTDKEVKSLYVYNNDIYMAQYNTITVVKHAFEENITYDLDIEDMWGILVKDKSTIFISQVRNPSNIYKYDTVHDTTEVVAEGLNMPLYMSMMYTKEGYKYIISEQDGHSLKVYNRSWELLHSFGSEGTSDGQFKGYSPMATTVTDMGTILVADQGNDRISHFTIEGQFLSHVATKDDGIVNPIGLCYKHPYLWVTRSFAKNVKCLEITKHHR